MFLLGCAVVVGVGALLWQFRTGQTQPDHAVAMLMLVLGTLTVAWIGVRGPAAVPISDVPLIVAMGLLAGGMLVGSVRLSLPWWLYVVAGGLIVSAILAALFVPDPPGYVLEAASAATIGAASSRASDFALLARVEYAMVILPALISIVVTSSYRARLLADIWFASAVICALVGVLDTVLHTDLASSLVNDPLSPSGGPVRALGLTFHPNYLGLYAAMAVPLGITRLAQPSGPGRVVFGASIAILILAVQLSGSRIALLAMLVGVAALLVLVPVFRNRVVIAIVSAAAIAGVLFVLAPSEQSAIERLSGDASADEATSVRLEVIGDSLDVGLDNGLTGVGYSRVLDSHSVPVQFLEAGGIVGLAMFLLWSAGILGLGRRVSRSGAIPVPSAQIASALTAALFAWLLTSLLSPQLVERFMYVPAGILMGLALVAARQTEDESGEDELPASISSPLRDPSLGSPPGGVANPRQALPQG